MKTAVLILAALSLPATVQAVTPQWITCEVRTAERVERAIFAKTGLYTMSSRCGVGEIFLQEVAGERIEATFNFWDGTVEQSLDNPGHYLGNAFGLASGRATVTVLSVEWTGYSGETVAKRLTVGGTVAFVLHWSYLLIGWGLGGYVDAARRMFR